MVNQARPEAACLKLSTYYLEDGHQLTGLHRHHCCRAYMPTSSKASHDNHEKFNSWVSFSFLYGYGRLRLAVLRATGAPL